MNGTEFKRNKIIFHKKLISLVICKKMRWMLSMYTQGTFWLYLWRVRPKRLQHCNKHYIKFHLLNVIEDKFDNLEKKIHCSSPLKLWIIQWFFHYLLVLFSLISSFSLSNFFTSIFLEEVFFFFEQPG